MKTILKLIFILLSIWVFFSSCSKQTFVYNVKSVNDSLRYYETNFFTVHKLGWITHTVLHRDNAYIYNYDIIHNGDSIRTGDGDTFGIHFNGCLTITSNEQKTVYCNLNNSTNE